VLELVIFTARFRQKKKTAEAGHMASKISLMLCSHIVTSLSVGRQENWNSVLARG